MRARDKKLYLFPPLTTLRPYVGSSTLLNGLSSFLSKRSEQHVYMHELDSSGRAIGAARYPSLCQFASGTNLVPLRREGSLGLSKMVPHHRRAPWFVPRLVCASEKPVITHAFTARVAPFWQLASHSE